MVNKNIRYATKDDIKCALESQEARIQIIEEKLKTVRLNGNKRI
jgi:hypothetical protein